MTYSEDGIYEEPNYIEPVLGVSPIQSVGYDSAPINQKTQAYNRYLDSCTIKSQSATGTTSVFTFTKSNLNIIGKYQRNIWTGWKIIIPVNWTYLITCSAFEYSWTTKIALQISNASWTLSIWTSATNSLEAFESTNLVTTVNAKSWDYILFNGYTWAARWSIVINATITKIS